MRGLGMRGFTLIELVITVAIVAILAGIAYPSFMDSIRKSRRAEAQAVLLEMQVRQEKWRANNNTYNGTATAVGAPAAGSGIAAYYTFTVSGAGATAYSLSATAISGKGQDQDKQGGASCSPMTLNQSGTRAPATCWRK